MEDLPAEIGNLKKLNILNLSNNKLEKFPHEFYKLNELHELNLKNNSNKGAWSSSWRLCNVDLPGFII